MVKRDLQSNQKLFLINTKTALLKVNHVEHQTQTMLAGKRLNVVSGKLGEISNGGIANSGVVTGLLVSFAHCTLRVIKAVDMYYNSAGM